MPEKEKKNEEKSRISRRQFLGTSLKAGAGVAAEPFIKRQPPDVYQQQI